MSSNKQQKESPFGCALTIFGGLIFILLIIALFEEKAARPSAWARVLVWSYIVFVLFALSKTKFKKFDDYLK
jgi:uncharacterized protein (DUF983 family)